MTTPLVRSCQPRNNFHTQTVVYWSQLDRHKHRFFLKEMCSVRCKNHGCRQKIPEDTSSAKFVVRTITKCCEFKRCTSTRFDVTGVTQVTVFITINTGAGVCFFLFFFWGGECVRTAAKKTMVVDRKKPEGTTSAIFEIGTAAKYCEPQALFQTRSQHGTDNKDEVFKSNLNFLLS